MRRIATLLTIVALALAAPALGAAQHSSDLLDHRLDPGVATVALQLSSYASSGAALQRSKARAANMPADNANRICREFDDETGRCLASQKYVRECGGGAAAGGSVKVLKRVAPTKPGRPNGPDGPRQPVERGESDAPDGGDGDKTPDRGGRGPCGTSGNSFVGATRVLMASGAWRRIDRLRVGDVVLAMDTQTRRTVARRVERVLAHVDARGYVSVQMGGGSITATGHHAFWNATSSKWQRADTLGSAARLLNQHGTQHPVRVSPTGTRNTLAYDLTINTTHNYIVRIGTTAALVHNVDCNPWDDVEPSEDAQKIAGHAQMNGHEIPGVDPQDYARYIEFQMQKPGYPVTSGGTAWYDEVRGVAIFKRGAGGTQSSGTAYQMPYEAFRKEIAR